MKIVLVNNLFLPLKAGGAEKIVEHQASLLTKFGHDVSIVTIGANKGLKTDRSTYNIFYLPNKFIYHRIDAFRQNIFKKMIFHWQNIFSCAHSQQLEKLLNELKPDLVWTHNLSGFGWQAVKTINKLNYRHWHQLHDFQLINPFGTFLLSEKNKLNNLPLSLKAYSSLSKKIFNQTEMIIAPSRFVLDVHCNNGFFTNQKKEIIPNPIEDQDLEAEPLNTKTANKFLYIGQLENYKGINTLIKAFHQIDNPNLELRIVGQGSLMQECQVYAQKDKRIFIEGWCDGLKVKQLIKNSDVVLYPSECYENLPTVIIEAQTLARPVIASNIGGIKEMITGKDGLLIEAGDISAWRQAIISFSVGRYNLSDMSNNALVASKKYSIENYYRLLSNFL